VDAKIIGIKVEQKWQFSGRTLFDYLIHIYHIGYIVALNLLDTGLELL
jgi:hypothetical protein